MPDPYPLLSKPLLKPKIWGGRRLEKWLDQPLPHGEQIGEAWLAADLREGKSAIANGSLKGQTLSDAMQLWNEKLAGTAWSDERFPLLIKFIDANDDLSVQVHPSDADAAKYFPDEFGKDEAWIVLESENGRIVSGFKSQVTLEEFDRRLNEGSLEECLQYVAVKRGDVTRIAPGTVHALCKGVMILEIQQPSDSTFRIYDYNRPGADGKPRPLHIVQARKVMKVKHNARPLIEPAPSRRDWGRHECLLDVPAYRIERAYIEKALKWRVDSRSAQVLIVIGGAATINANGSELDVHRGNTVILPAALETVSLHPSEPSQLIMAGASRVPMLTDEGV